MHRFIVVIGVPGCGKTTLMETTRDLFPGGWSFGLVGGHGGAAINRYLVGYYRSGGFDGTDQLSFTAATALRNWIPTLAAPSTIVWEGDRLSNSKVFASMAQHGALQIVLLDVDAESLGRRLKRRAEQVGKPQDATWLKGRTSKVSKLSAEWFGNVLRWQNTTASDLALNTARLRALILNTQETMEEFA